MSDVEEMGLTPKHKELLKRLQSLFPEAHLNVEERVNLINRGGWAYAHGPGISLMRITSSYESGPEWDFFPEIAEILQNCGFKMERYETSGCDERNLENYECYYFLEKGSIVYDC